MTPFMIKYCSWCYPKADDPRRVLLDVVPAEKYGTTAGICPRHYQEAIQKMGEEEKSDG